MASQLKSSKSDHIKNAIDYILSSTVRPILAEKLGVNPEAAQKYVRVLEAHRQICQEIIRAHERGDMKEYERLLARFPTSPRSMFPGFAPALRNLANDIMGTEPGVFEASDDDDEADFNAMMAEGGNGSGMFHESRAARDAFGGAAPRSDSRPASAFNDG